MTILIVEADYYDNITGKLVEDAVEEFKQHGVGYQLLRVPGALEIPAAIAMAEESGMFDGYLAIGCVIRGETYHFEIVANESAKALNDLAVLFTIPISNAILTVENKKQAEVRAFEKQKGREYASVVLRMIEIREQFIAPPTLDEDDE